MLLHPGFDRRGRETPISPYRHVWHTPRARFGINPALGNSEQFCDFFGVQQGFHHDGTSFTTTRSHHSRMGMSL
jgi:hypothetical protein